MNKTELGQNIRCARLEKGYTQEQLSEKAGIGPMFMGEIERGVKMPSLNTFISIVEALEVSADYILRGQLSSGKDYIFDELTDKLKNLSPKQRQTAAHILDAYIAGLKEE